MIKQFKKPFLIVFIALMGVMATPQDAKTERKLVLIESSVCMNGDGRLARFSSYLDYTDCPPPPLLCYPVFRTEVILLF